MRTTVMMASMALGVLPFVAVAQSADVGGELAERWCMGCHVVETGPGDVASDGVPTFPAIAAKPSTTAASLDRYLSSGHTTMPDFSLSRDERGALVAYLLSLR
jgi:mono/diheme cytochrome c family protein